MSKFSIIVPVCGQPEVTRRCLKRLVAYTTDYELIVVDNGGDFKSDLPCEIIRNKENKGFPAAVNQGIAKAVGDVIVILNNDAMVTPNWTDHLAEQLKTADVVGPVTNNCSGPQKISYPMFAGVDGANTFAAALYKERCCEFTPIHHLVFFCVAIKREVIKAVGNLDEEFSPGNFEDDDFCLRAVEKGFRLAVAEDVFVFHYGSLTHKGLGLDYQKLLAVNEVKFKNKWPQDRYRNLSVQAMKNFSGEILNPRSPLTLVMVVKNEGKGVERAILSCSGLVSDIVVAVDDSSTDKTEAVAKKYGALIKHFTFHGSFSEIRNFAQEGVKTPWCLILDGHEFVKERGKIFEALKSDVDGLLCTVEMETGFRFRNPRIVRSNVKYLGRVHEQQLCNKVRPFFDFVIKHDRLKGQSVQSAKLRKAQRDEHTFEALKADLRENKNNTNALLHLILHYQAKFKTLKAKLLIKRFIKIKPDRQYLWFLFYNQALTYLTLKRRCRAYVYACQAERAMPGRWETKRLKGLIFLESKNWGKAVEFLIQSIGTNKFYCHFEPLLQNLGSVWGLIGEAYFSDKNYFKAEIAFKRSSEIAVEPALRDLSARRSELMRNLSNNLVKLK
jgi:GT2 family glycosyltransferase